MTWPASVLSGDAAELITCSGAVSPNGTGRALQPLDAMVYSQLPPPSTVTVAVPDRAALSVLVARIV